MRRSGIVELVAADMNVHGMFLATKETPQAGSLLQLEVFLPDGPTITMFVIARFVGKTTSGEGIGAEIYLLGPEERRAWNRYYRRLLAQKTAQASIALMPLAQIA